MRLILTSILCSAFLTVTSAAPVPKDAENQQPFFATQKGAKWVYLSSDGETICTVTDVEDKGGGAKLVTRRFKNLNGKDWISKTLVSNDGLYEQLSQQPPDSLGACLLKLPHRDGATWNMDNFLQMNLKVTDRMTSFGPEEIEVPAGKFQAIRVVGEKNLNGKVFTGTHWYVRGIGVVKSELAGKVHLTLKSFTPGDSR